MNSFRDQLQEDFNTIVKHARKMKAAAADKYGCYYRMQDGNRCFIGALIPDEVYRPEFENTSLWDIMRVLGKIFDIAYKDLQRIHDKGYSSRTIDEIKEQWEKDFVEFAEKYNLTIPAKENDEN